ncbi:alkaline phosphatase family protein [Nocardioides sp. CFH 31398]|uniref:alkaline phosphatase family protein n=1 Tax=Nocardioides sp. CFH 31398 TaxID=2919579 RepID=UPI001F0552FC|nr:alkaline phosphatase family protein [Nocardioides sp. CFH 31398]MCH1866709.1 alkaline phosphatase family protein [Nocardioides sp. CFH 31398]
MSGGRGVVETAGVVVGLAAVVGLLLFGLDLPLGGGADRPEAAGGQRTAERRQAPAPGPALERRVVVVSVDGLTPGALETVGRAGAPAMWSVLDGGASTMDARTDHDLTVTLPNHTGMVTGRTALPELGGHGVVWNEPVLGAVVPGDGSGEVGSIFTQVHAAGGSTALFTGKPKFEVFPTTWPNDVDRYVFEPGAARLTRLAARELRTERPDFLFVHLAQPDNAGHASGWMSAPYLDAVEDADASVGRLLEVVDATPELRRDTVVVLTTDHGGRGRGHGDPTAPVEYRIPFAVAGPGVATGDLYALAPGLTDPGAGRPGMDDPAPVRNCDVANVAAAVLGVAAVPGSQCVAAEEMTALLGVG